MAVSELSAVLKLEFGEFKSSLSVAKSSMNDFAKETQKSMEQANESTQKSQGIFSKAFNGMANAGDKLKAKQSSLTSTLAKTALGFVGIRSAADIFNSAIGRVDKIESAKKSIEALTGSQEDARTVMEGLQKVVEGTPLSLDNFTASAKGMVAAGMEAGKVEGIMTAVGDAAFGVGNGAESIDLMAGAFKSLQASGTASLGDLNRLMDQNIPVYKILGNQLDKSTEDMKKFISDGMLPSGEAMDLLVKGIEEGTDGINGSTAGMAGQMATAGDTIAGAAGNIKTAFVKSLAVPITKSYEKIVNGMKAVKDGIKAAQPSIEAAFTVIAEVIEGVILGIVDTFNMLKPTFEAVGAVISKVAELFKVAGSDGKGFKEMARELTPVLLALLAGFKTITTILKFASTLRTVTTAVKGMASGLKLAGTASKIAAVGIKGVGAAIAFLTSPIGLIIVAITAVVAGIVYLWKTNEDFRNAIKSIWEGIKAAFEIALQVIIGIMKGLWEGIKSAWDSIVSVFTTVITFISNVVQVGFLLIKSIVEGVMLVIQTVVQFVWNAIKAYFTFVFAIFQAIFTVAFNILKTIVETVFNVIKTIIETVWNAIVAFFTPIFAVLQAIFTVAWNIISTIISSVLDVITSVITATWNVIKTVTETVWNIISAVLTTIWNGLVLVVTTVWNVISSIISTIWGTIQTVTTAVWNVIKGILTTVWNGIVLVVTTAINTVKSVVTSVWNGISAVTSAIWNTIKSVISTVVNSIKAVVTTVVNGIKSTITSVWNSIKSVTTAVWNGIKSAMTKPVEAAKNVIKGIIDAIKGFFSGLKLKLPEIQMPKLPHFSLTGSFSLKPPSVPKLGVDWYATGGIATGPSVVGIGEAGSEAILPLSNKGRMKPFAQAVSSYMDTPSNPVGVEAETRPIILHNTMEIDGKSFVKQVVQYIQIEVDKYVARQMRKRGDL